MKRPLQNRLFALLGAIAFVFGTAGDGFGLHPCPHHSGGTHAGSESRNDTHHGHPAIFHDGALAGTAPGDTHTPESEHSGPCTCGSACQAGSAIALPGLEISEPSAQIAEGPTPSIVESGLLVVERPPYFLPLALAPPA